MTIFFVYFFNLFLSKVGYKTSRTLIQLFGWGRRKKRYFAVVSAMTHVVENKVQMKNHKFKQNRWKQQEQEPLQQEQKPPPTQSPGARVSQVGQAGTGKAEHPCSASPCAPPTLSCQNGQIPLQPAPKAGENGVPTQIPVGKHPLAPHPSQHLPSILTIPAWSGRSGIQPSLLQFAKGKARKKRVSEGQRHWKNAYRFVLFGFFPLQGKMGSSGFSS